MKRNEFDTASQYYAQVVAEFPRSPLNLYARARPFTHVSEAISSSDPTSALTDDGKHRY